MQETPQQPAETVTPAQEASPATPTSPTSITTPPEPSVSPAEPVAAESTLASTATPEPTQAPEPTQEAKPVLFAFPENTGAAAASSAFPPLPELKTVTYTGINPPTIREKLVGKMAICTLPERTLRHQHFDVINPSSRVMTGTISLEVEISRITLRYEGVKPAADQPQPPAIVLGVSDFDTTLNLLKSIGMHDRSFQETKCEVWEIGTTKIVIEWWPWLEPFITISAPTTEDIAATASTIGLTDEQIHKGNTANLYTIRYGIDETVFRNTPKLLFMSRPDWMK